MSSEGGRHSLAPAAPNVLLVPRVQGSAPELPGRPQEGFHQRLNLQRTEISLGAFRSRNAFWMVLVMSLAFIWRWWDLMSPTIIIWLCTYWAVVVTGIMWQIACPASLVKWHKVLATLLGLSSFGLGWAFILIPKLLGGFPVPDEEANADGVVVTARHAVLLLFASNAVSLACMQLAFRMRLGPNMAVYVAVAVGAIAHARTMCAAALLSSPAAQRAAHKIYALLSYLSYTLPLPLSPVVAPRDTATECVTILSFFQLSLGMLIPLLLQGMSEAHAFQHHQEQRWQVGLEPEGGMHAVVYDFLSWISLGGTWPHVVLIYWLVLAACWDWTAFLWGASSPTAR